MKWYKKKYIVNSLLILSSILLATLFAELVIFRLIFVAPDMPKLEFVDGIVKCKPNQKGVYRVLNEINAEYNTTLDSEKINNVSLYANGSPVMKKTEKPFNFTYFNIRFIN